MTPLVSDTGVSRNVAFFDHGLFLLHLNRGKEELRQGHHEEARRELEEARRFRSQDPEVLANLGFALFHLGHYEEAETVTRHVLASHPTSVPLLFNLGLILFKSGRQEASCEPLQRVLALQPNHRKAHLTLGLALQRMGDSDKARDHLRAAGAEPKAGFDLDDTVSRAARAASAAPPPPSDDETAKHIQTTPIVKPERFDQMAAAPPPATAPPAAQEAVTTETAASADVPLGDAPEAAPPPRSGSTIPIEIMKAPKALGPFTPSGGGFLSADCRKGVIVRRNTIAGRRGSLFLQPDRSLVGALAGLLVETRGPGTMLLVDKGRHPNLVALSDEFFSVDPLRLIAFDDALAFREDPVFEFRRHIPLPFLKLFGSGAVAFSALLEPARFEVDPENPISLTSASVIAYSGDLNVDILEGSDPFEQAGLGPVMRFSGSGYVLAEGG